MVVVSGIISKMDTRKHRPTYKSTKKSSGTRRLPTPLPIAYTFYNTFFSGVVIAFFRIYKKPLTYYLSFFFFFFIKLIIYIYSNTPLHLLGKTTKNRDIFSNFKFHRKPLFEMGMWRCCNRSRCRQ